MPDMQVDLNNPDFGGGNGVSRQRVEIDRHPSADAVMRLRDLLAKHIVSLSQTSGGEIASTSNIGKAAAAHAKATDEFVQILVGLDHDLSAWQRQENNGPTGEYLDRKLHDWLSILPRDKSFKPSRREAEAAIHDAYSTGLFDALKVAFVKQGGNRRDYEAIKDLESAVVSHLTDLVRTEGTGNATERSINKEDSSALSRRIGNNQTILRTLNDMLYGKSVDVKVLKGQLDALAQFAEQHPIASTNRADEPENDDLVPFVDTFKEKIRTMRFTEAFRNAGLGGEQTVKFPLPTPPNSGITR